MWETCKIVNFPWLLFSTLVIGQNLLTQKNTLSKWSVNAFYYVNGLHVSLCILCVKMRTFLCGESTVTQEPIKFDGLLRYRITKEIAIHLTRIIT